MNIQRDLELKMIELVNDVRMKHGLHHLDFCDGLCTIARKHSLDQLQSNEIFHVSKKTGTPKDRMVNNHYPYVYFGENVAMGQNMEILHQKLLKSKEHFKNIVHTEFSHVGIGILANSNKKLFITQLFSKKLAKYDSNEILNHINNEFRQKRKGNLPFVAIATNQQIKQCVPIITTFRKPIINRIEQAVQQYNYQDIKVHFQTFNDLSSIKLDNFNHPNLRQVVVGIEQNPTSNKILLVYLFS